MKIATKDIEQFINNIPKSIKAILIYGPDTGLIKARINIITKTRNIASIYKYDQIKNNPEILLDSLRSISLFGEDLSKQKTSIIECNSAVISEAISNSLKNDNFNGLLVFSASDLGPESSLRKFFDTNANTASIACYIEDQATIARIIQQQLKSNGISCEPGLVQTLIQYISIGDHALVVNELEKIFLFFGNKKHLEIQDLRNFLELQPEISFDKLCYQISLKKFENIEVILDRLQSEGHSLVSIIRMMLRHFNRLYQVKSLIEQGASEKQALDALSPPVFFKQMNDFTNSLKLWSST
ncbi:MAG: hypothetical protein AABY27_02240, partial [Pseudomonadota bacterium]